MSKVAVRLLYRLILVGSLLPWRPPAASAAPATAYTVVSTLDNPDTIPGNNICADSNGLCTLRAAVMEANAHAGPDTILLPPDNFQLTRAGAEEDLANTGDLDLTGSVTLQGLGPGPSVVEAAGLNDRVFDVLTGTLASLSQMTIRGGLVPNLGSHTGGGVLNRGTLTLTQVLITRNNVTLPTHRDGGGLGNTSLGVLTLNNSQVISNAAINGGGILNDGVMAINASQVLSNAADAGGGFFNRGQMVIDSSTLAGNHAVAVGGGAANYASDSRLSVSGSTIRDNTSGGTGGGLHMNAGVLTVTTTGFAGNHADSGGALFGRTVMTITHSTLMSNTAAADGGALALDASAALWLANVTLAGNSAGGNGGGLANSGGALDGYNLTVAGNTANADGADSGTGGGLYQSSGSAALHNSLLAYNQRFVLSIVLVSDCAGTFGTFHYSLVQETLGCAFTNDNTLTGQDPLLLPLADNGGPTLTRALGPGSPALDAADPAGCESPFGGLLLTDQRGYARQVDGDHNGVARCDMGAFEALQRLFLPLLLR